MRKSCLALFVLFLTGCNSDRMAVIEKKTAELERQVAQLHQSAQLDLQAKCAKDAKAWFDVRWQSDKDTILLDYVNHYSTTKNKCFINVEFHYKGVGPEFSWFNHISLHDVYENQKYGQISERHQINEDKVTDCEVYGKKCTTMQEYQSLIDPFMNK